MNIIKEWAGVATMVLLVVVIVIPMFNSGSVGAAGGQYMEQYIPVVRINGGMATALPFDMDGTSANLSVGGTMAVTGATTQTGALSVTGVTTLSETLVVNEATGTSTLTVQSTAASVGGTLILEDVDGAGCSGASVLNGTASWATVACP